jgi:LPS sulfotransferase NodH
MMTSTPSTRYTELQLSSAAFDRPRCPIEAKLFICTTGRTGSWLLCRALIHHGIGVPHEYFNPRYIPVIAARYGIEASSDDQRWAADSDARRSYIAALQERRTVNGIFASKIHWSQFAAYLQNREGAELLNGGHFIYLYREDLLAQTLSFHVAIETGRWGSDSATTTGPLPAPRFFDTKLIAERMRRLVDANGNWRLFFASNGLSPVVLTYEGIRNNTAGALRTIVERFGLRVPATSLDYVEDGPQEIRDEGVPPRAEIRAHFLKAYQFVGAAGPSDPAKTVAEAGSEQSSS